MSIIGQRSLLRSWIDSFQLELGPPVLPGPSAGASGSTTPERSAKEGSEIARCFATSVRQRVVARNGAAPAVQPVTRIPSMKIA